MFLKNMALADKITLRVLQSKNLFTFTNLNCENAGNSKVLLFSIMRYKGKEGKKERPS